MNIDNKTKLKYLIIIIFGFLFGVVLGYALALPYVTVLESIFS